jgi:hypothetical protein
MRVRRPGDGLGERDDTWSCPPMWAGETVFVLAGGPSLRGFDAAGLRGRGRILAIKESALLVPFADALLFVDADWFVRERALVDRFAGDVVTTATNAAGTRCRLMRRGEASGLSDRTDTLNYAYTTVHAALNFIAHTRASRGVCCWAWTSATVPTVRPGTTTATQRRRRPAPLRARPRISPPRSRRCARAAWRS